MNKFINDWGTEVALVIAITGSLFLMWLIWPNKSHKPMWRLALSALGLSAVAGLMYGYARMNGVNL